MLLFFLCPIIIKLIDFIIIKRFMQDIEARRQGEEERAARNARRRKRQRRQWLQERREFLRHAPSAPAMGVS